jgi:GntR family transcriptional regulator / MocR family aminotransferase
MNPGEINFLYCTIADDDFPKLMWRKLYNQVLMRRQANLYYAAPEGTLELRSELQDYLLRASGLSCTKEKSSVFRAHNKASIFVHGSWWILNRMC